MGFSDFANKLGSRLRTTLTKPSFEAVEELRSLTDFGFYTELVRRAAANRRVFEGFKHNPIYRKVLEHVSQEQGARYLDQIEKKWPELLKEIERYKINDRCGNPIRFRYPRIGEISPTTLRYLKVCCDLRELFGSLDGMNLAEIGVGYGGQFLLSDVAWNLGSWTLFDLDPVLQLTNRYLECHLIKSVYRPTTLNRFDCREAQFDLAISNYAFSELPRALQLAYIGKVLRKAKRGYMTMNSGKQTGSSRHMSLEELRECLPGLREFAEVPLTAKDNYVLVWGQLDPRGG